MLLLGSDLSRCGKGIAGETRYKLGNEQTNQKEMGKEKEETHHKRGLDAVCALYALLSFPFCFYLYDAFWVDLRLLRF